MKMFRLPAALLVVFLSACDLGIDPTAMPAIDPNAYIGVIDPVVSSTPQETVPQTVSGASQTPPSEPYWIAGYQHATDARTDGVGIVQDRDFKGGDRLIENTIATARLDGVTNIVVRGTADNKITNIGAQGNRELAAARAEDTAKKLRAQMQAELVESGLCESGQRRASCLRENNISIVAEADPVMSGCRKTGCDLNAGRKTAAYATFIVEPVLGLWVCDANNNSTWREDGKKQAGDTDLPCPTTPTTTTTTTSIPGTTTTSISGTTTTTTTGPSTPTTSTSIPPTNGGTPDPSRGIFGSFPTGGSTATGGSTPPGGAAGDGPTDGSSTYRDFYPEDVVDLDTVSVVFLVDVPATLRAGGSLREADVELDDVTLYCGDTPCTSPAVRLDAASGSLTLGSSSPAYRLCASPRSSSCEYYLATGSKTGFTATASAISGGDLRVGFRSPTGSNVRVEPTLKVGRVDVTLSEPVWVGGRGCDADLPPRSCWSWEEFDSIDIADAAAVLSTRGEIFSGTRGEFRLSRPVFGTTGSN